MLAMLVQTVCLSLPGRWREQVPQLYWQGVAWLLGLRLTVIGARATERPVLFVANHCSWLDIIVLGATLPACFVAKGAIADWPLIGRVAVLGRTIFVSRNRMTVPREQSEIARRLSAGDNIILFPEGTTSDGRRILPFASSFLALAEAKAAPRVQPVTLVYDALDDLPVQYYDRPEISWYGDMDLVPHYWRIGRRRRLHVTILLGEPVEPKEFANRKILSAWLEARLAREAAALRQGRMGAHAAPDQA